MSVTRHHVHRGCAMLLLLSSTAMSASAFAQAADPAADDADILVTGTRIQGVDASGAVQAITVDRETIIESGATTLIDVLRDVPSTGGGGATFSTASAGPLSSDTPVGAAGVSLRGLGVSSTLTLINGRRATISAFARGQESFIDVTSIPLAAVERVEVLPSGASAIYGADAVAGVVNYVLRDDYEGIELSASYGDSTADSNEARYNLTGVIGAKFGDHSVMLVADYFKRNPFFLRDRRVSRDSFRPSQQGIYPSFNDLFFQTFDQTEEPQDGGCPADDFGSGNLGEFCEVDTNDFVSASDRLETIGGIFTHKWQVSDGISWYNEVLYQRSTSRGVSSPANFSRTPIDPENPNWPAALQQDIVEEGGVDDFSDYFGFPIYGWGKFIEPRAVSVKSDSFRVTSGLRGDISGDWTFDAAFLVGGNNRTQRGLSGLVVARNFYDANLGNVCTDGSRVQRWDVDLTRPDAEFVGDTCEYLGKATLWYNPFGGQANQVDGIAELLGTTAKRSGRARLYAFDASTTGSLFDLGGRTVKGAFGGEFRRETLRDTPSGIAIATEDNPEPILGFSSTSARAKRNSWSLYGEVYVPVADNFDLQIAGRFDHFQGFGGDFNPKVAARWQPVSWLTLRGNYATSFRAPSLAQSGAGVLLSSYRVDCTETPEACDGDATADGEALLSEDVGNVNLEAESARSFGGGFVVAPSRDLELRVDYWNIRHKNLVGIDEDDFIRRALAGEFTVAGPGLLPTGTPGVEVTNGFVTDAHFQLTNLGFQKTDGIDGSFTWHLPETGIGRFSLLFDATYYLNFKRQASDNSPVEQLAGDYLYPRFYSTGRLRWRNGAWRTTVSARYTSGYRDDPTQRTLEAVGLPPDARVRVDDYLTFDLNMSYDFTTNTVVQLNVRNVFDRQSPRVLGSGSNVDLFNHDLIGRFVTLRLTQRF
jgi:iron complex outermembrane receptor protein